ncbi:tRNA uridine-5-carboxymethylaminomethyl(34) synthesis enzyme MnmG [Candidatus Comchoanobacter bicostacola]|uniref:tRNA uridine 5-carboxymethylaminomethyl modification enzyme MnmG n=1 Tax=Candidatus Comchoanobacter bicostacola TaxID=2919598 RepID=A0ABY5DKP0_9GAMM|nr:tRNA uridine-5-carboxymethylaminomethyl(34) synthesis enzyme MnmG [Candidatus Comchoanobacter bicostacola]UTC24557.1 tRNA uridine-5-carboxymethylaminomethyl(34) synthesis enzyme MnmG [Candidatus Comchoanobacter bicostacola]
MNQVYEVIIIGGGHAGSEAACASARMGAKTLLLTHNIDTIGVMSCNPAIGGLGKTHLVREIDALDGLMGKAADASAIHRRTLNTSKGAAVQAVRVQSCRDHYRQSIRQQVEQTENLTLFQSEVTDVLIEGNQVVGVETKYGVRFGAKKVILTTGTFLAGRLHVGTKEVHGGRSGDQSADVLAETLKQHFDIGRLKTGTPPRIARNTIDFSELEVQPSDGNSRMISALGSSPLSPQVCHITYTNERSHDVIRKFMQDSPIFQQRQDLKGPRYCPSIEQKVDRFSEKNAHQIFIEPEGVFSNEIYPNGISTSLSYEAQKQFIATIKGFEHAVITRPGYAVSYGYFDPRGLYPWLETKVIDGLFFAGQINGTTGYEEAGAQGLMAGINAALQLAGKEPWVMSRSEGYIGVLIDDLVTNGTIEPYRMFTSRAEHRLSLRSDNAGTRLTQKGIELGVVKKDRQEWFTDYTLSYQGLEQQMHTVKVSVKGKKISLAAYVRQPNFDRQLLEQSLAGPYKKDVLEDVVIALQYTGYIEKQARHISRVDASDHVSIPSGFDYMKVKGLSSEVSEKLKHIQPVNIGQARRISGITPAAISLLTLYLRRVPHSV